MRYEAMRCDMVVENLRVPPPPPRASERTMTAEGIQILLKSVTLSGRLKRYYPPRGTALENPKPTARHRLGELSKS